MLVKLNFYVILKLQQILARLKMAFCRLSNDFNKTGRTQIDNNFIVEFLPELAPRALKVYLYGLLKCQNSAGYDNTLESFEENLGITKEDVINCFLYWQDQNLVQVLETDPIEVRYLPTKDNLKNLKKIRKYGRNLFGC